MILNIYRDRYEPRFILHSNDFIIEHDLHPLKIDYTGGGINSINISFKPKPQKCKLMLGFSISNSNNRYIQNLNFENITRLQDLNNYTFSAIFNILPNLISIGDIDLRELILVKSLIVTKEEFKSFIYQNIHFSNIFRSCFLSTDKYNFIRLYLLRTWLCSYIPDTDKMRYINYSLNILLRRVLNSL